MNREKVIKAYEDFVNGYECFCTSDDYEYEMHKAVLALLKEQEAQKFFVDESGKITPLPVVVRCKDCKNADYGTDEDGNRFMKCIGSVKCYGGTTPDFYCADGERGVMWE